jgi:hypothetical protein
MFSIIARVVLYGRSAGCEGSVFIGDALGRSTRAAVCPTWANYVTRKRPVITMENCQTRRSSDINKWHCFHLISVFFCRRFPRNSSPKSEASSQPPYACLLTVKLGRLIGWINPIPNDDISFSVSRVFEVGIQGSSRASVHISKCKWIHTNIRRTGDICIPQSSNSGPQARLGRKTSRIKLAVQAISSGILFYTALPGRFFSHATNSMFVVEFPCYAETQDEMRQSPTTPDVRTWELCGDSFLLKLWVAVQDQHRPFICVWEHMGTSVPPGSRKTPH